MLSYNTIACIFMIAFTFASLSPKLEEGYGVDAIKTSRLLVKGKMKVAMMITIKNSLIFVAIEFGLAINMVSDGGFGSGLLKMLVVLLMVVVLIMLIVFGLVSFNVLYFVCKAHHHEKVDKSRLFDHLEGYFGEFEPLKGRDVQLERYSV
ncbi:hypothetical protein J5N97_020052 [Dioscorea zingiberensis]|uniref:Uncharacterized protein n=1 Tax=Dioscorea zingiberensis TaxID=325984 RepID=A0A9D5HDG1_9LILI|nr:hypothetical protein J5N97_020052 [Dioscorea zingiberensis]